VDSVVYGCTDGSEVRQYGSILTITLNSFYFTGLILNRRNISTVI